MLRPRALLWTGGRRGLILAGFAALLVAGVLTSAAAGQLPVGPSDVVGTALHGIGIDLSADYLRLAEWRCNDPALRAKVLRVDKPKAVPDGQLDIFGGAA